MNAGDTNRPAPGQSLRTAARGSVLNLLGMAVAAVATFTLAVTLTRVSTPAAAGVFFSATSLFLLATSLGRLGTNTGLVYFISGARGRGELGLARRHLRLAATPVFIVAALMSVTFFVGADQLAQWLSAEQPEAFAKNLQIMAVLVPVAAAAQLLSAASQGLGTMRMYSVLEQMLLPLAQLVLVGALLALGHPTVTAAGWTVAFVPVAVLAWFWWQRLVGRVDDVGRGESPTRTVTGREFWKFTAPRALAGVSQIAMQRLDIILVGALASLSAAAVYATLTRFLVLGQMAGRAFSLSVQPLLAAALARRDLEDARSLYQSCTAWLVLGTWPLYLTLIGLAPWALGIFGRGYEQGSRSLILLCGVMLFATACGMVDIVLNMAGKSVWNLVNVLIAFAFFLTLNVLLIPRLGVFGAAVSWGTAIVIMNALPLTQILFTPGAHPFGRATLLAMGMATLCFGAIPWLARQLSTASVTASMTGLAIGLLGYLAFLLIGRRTLQLSTLLQALQIRGRGRIPVT